MDRFACLFFFRKLVYCSNGESCNFNSVSFVSSIMFLNFFVLTVLGSVDGINNRSLLLKQVSHSIESFTYIPILSPIYQKHYQNIYVQPKVFFKPQALGVHPKAFSVCLSNPILKCFVLNLRSR